MKDLISTKDLLKDDFKALIAQAKHFKELNLSEARQENKLAGKSVIQEVFENSTRTRMRFVSVGAQVDWMIKTSLPRTLSPIWTLISPSLKRFILASLSGIPRYFAIWRESS